MERRELLGVSTFILSSGALIGLTQLPDGESETNGQEPSCNPESIHNSERKVLSGQQWSRDFVVSEQNPVFSIRATTDNDQIIRIEIEDSDGNIVEEKKGASLKYTNVFETFGVGEVRIYNTGEVTETGAEELWSNEVEKLDPNSELSLWIQTEKNEEIVYEINTAEDGVEGELDVQIENESNEILKEDTISTSGKGTFIPKESGRHYLRFTNNSEETIEWVFSFKRNIDFGIPTNVTVEIVKSQSSCSISSIESTFSEVTEI